MERSQQALGRAQFRAKGKWDLAQEVDSLLEELSVCLEEDAMCAALDRLVQGHRLSYTECCFSSLDGKTVKKCPHDMGLGLR